MRLTSKKILRISGVFSLALVLAFSNIISLLPQVLQENHLAEYLRVKEAYAAQGDGFVLYDQTTPDTNFQERAFSVSTSAVGAEASPFAGSGTSKHIKSVGSPTRDELLLGVQDSAGLLTIYKKNFAGSWVSQWTATVGDGNLARFDIRYEQTTGDALVVYSGNTTTAGQELKYQTWNGTSWSGAINLDAARTTGTIVGVKMDARGGSDVIGLVFTDSNLDLSANQWNGTSWFGEPAAALSTTLARSGGATPIATLNARPYDITFENLSGDMMIVWGDDSGSTAQLDPKYVTKTEAGAWSASTAIANLTEDGEMIDIASSPISDKIALTTVSVDSGNDANFIVWSGTAWGTAATDATVATIAAGDSSNNVEWLVSGANEVAILTYSDSAAGGIDWYVSTNGATPVAQTDNTLAPVIAGLEKSGFAKAIPGSPDKALFMFGDASSDYFLKIATLSGTTVTWSNPSGISAAIETGGTFGGFNPVTTVFSRYTPPTTTLSDAFSLEPSDSTIAPGSSALVDAFGLVATIGTDTVTGATVTLAAGTGAGIATVAITDDGDTVTYCSAAPSGDVATLTGCGIPVTTTEVQFKVKVTVLSHAAMPAPPGASYLVSALVTAFTSTNVQSPMDDLLTAIVTVDNASPLGATAVGGLEGDAKNTIDWTTSSSADFNTSSGSVVLRWASASAGAEVPVEGATYVAGNTITTATVACVISSAISTAESKVDGTGGSAGCTTAALVNGQSYTYKVFQKDARGNYDAGVTIGTFVPAVGISITSYTNSTETALNYAASCTGCGARIGGGALFRQSITITGIGFGADPGVANRSSATNNIKVGTQQIATSNVTAWAPTSITFLTDSAVAGDTDADWGTTFGGASALTVTAGGSTSGGVNFYVFPQVTSVTQPVGFAADTAREYDAADSDGVITVNGTRFGSTQGSGSVTTLAQSATVSSWANTAIQIQVPTTIVDTVNTGNIVVTQGTGSNGKTHTYANTLRVIPRILSNTADTDIAGNRVKILGNHFCQGASCPISPNRSTAGDNVKFGTTQALDTDFINSGGVPCSGNAQAWTASEICVQVPAGTPVGSQPTKVTSNTAYVSNTKAFTVPSTTPNDPNITAPRQYKADGTTVIAHMSSTNESTVILKADISAALSVNMALQVEVDATGAGFDGLGIVQGTVPGGGACTACTTLSNAQVAVTGLADGDKQWRARVINTTTLEVSGWVYYVNPSTAEVDFTVDTLGPTITFPSGDTCTGAMSQLGTNSVQINWSVNELATGQVEYSTASDLSGSTLYPATPAPSNLSHQVTLLNLNSGATYYFKVKSQDSGGNLSSRPSSGPYCSFTTGSNLSPAKTTKFHIIGSGAAVTNASPLSQNFTVVIPEDATTTKSIFVEIRGIYTSGAAAKDIVVQVNSETAKTYVVPPSSTSYFKVMYPMSTIINGPGVNTLTITPQANTSINVTSANVVVQYTYTP